MSPEALQWSLRNVGYGYGLAVSKRKLMSMPSVPASRALPTTFLARQQLAELYHHFDGKPYWTGQGAAENNHAHTNGTTGRDRNESSH